MNTTDTPVIKDIVWHEHNVNKAAAQKVQILYLSSEIQLAECL
jgi:hypothetical protein